MTTQTKYELLHGTRETRAHIDARLLFPDPAGQPDLDVYHWSDADGMRWLRQGDDLLVIPAASFGRFTDACEQLYTDGGDPLPAEPTRPERVLAVVRIYDEHFPPDNPGAPQSITDWSDEELHVILAALAAGERERIDAEP